MSESPGLNTATDSPVVDVDPGALIGNDQTAAGVVAPTVAVRPFAPPSRPSKVWTCSATMRPLRTLTLVATLVGSR